MGHYWKRHIRVIGLSISAFYQWSAFISALKLLPLSIPLEQCSRKCTCTFFTTHFLIQDQGRGFSEPLFHSVHHVLVLSSWLFWEILFITMMTEALHLRNRDVRGIFGLSCFRRLPMTVNSTPSLFCWQSLGTPIWSVCEFMLRIFQRN